MAGTASDGDLCNQALVNLVQVANLEIRMSVNACLQ